MRRYDLFLCGDVMTGRGIDQILPTPSVSQLYEPHVRDAREYVTLAEQVSGAIRRPVDVTYIWGDALAELARVAPAARIVNLETAVTRSEDAWPAKGINYRMHPANVDCLTALGIDVCVLANNHVLDWGESGLVETLECVHAAEIATAGAGRTAREAEAPATVALPWGGRVVVFGVGHESSGIPPSWRATEDLPGVALLGDLGPSEAEAIVERASRITEPGDIVVVSIHWGSNWGHDIPDEHVRFAHALIDGGIHLVHGHSSHRPRAIEIYRDKAILYGCGDFISDYEGIDVHEPFRHDIGPMYLATFECSGRGASLVSLRVVPFRVRKMRLERGTRDDAEPVAHACRRFGTEVVLLDDGSLVVPIRARTSGDALLASRGTLRAAPDDRMPAMIEDPREQPRPRERPELEISEEESPAAPTPRHRRERPARGEAPELPEEAPDVGIGLDERGEIDRRFEP